VNVLSGSRNRFYQLALVTQGWPVEATDSPIPAESDQPRNLAKSVTVE